MDPVPLFLPTRRERDFPSERFLAEQVRNHRFCRSEITLCTPGCPPHPLEAAGSLSASTSLSAQCMDITAPGPTPTAQSCRTPGPPRLPGGAESASPAHCGRREWLPGKSTVLTSKAAPGAEEQPQAARSTGNNRGRLCSKASGCPKNRERSG